MSRGARTRSVELVERGARLATPARLGVLGDTHGSSARSPWVVEQVADLFRRARVDCILHAGDVGASPILDRLGSVAPVLAVRGNADPPDLLDALPDRITIDIGSRRVLLMHGQHGKTALAAARAAVTTDLDLIVFGHSHRPLLERVGQTILFNAGSPTERRWNPHFGVGLISVSDDAIEPELVLFDNAAYLAHIEP